MPLTRSFVLRGAVCVALMVLSVASSAFAAPTTSTPIVTKCSVFQSSVFNGRCSAPNKVFGSSLGQLLCRSRPFNVNTLPVAQRRLPFCSVACCVPRPTTTTTCSAFGALPGSHCRLPGALITPSQTLCSLNPTDRNACADVCCPTLATTTTCTAFAAKLGSQCAVAELAVAPSAAVCALNPTDANACAKVCCPVPPQASSCQQFLVSGNAAAQCRSGQVFNNDPSLSAQLCLNPGTLAPAGTSLRPCTDVCCKPFVTTCGAVQASLVSSSDETCANPATFNIQGLLAQDNPGAVGRPVTTLLSFQDIKNLPCSLGITTDAEARFFKVPPACSLVCPCTATCGSFQNTGCSSAIAPPTLNTLPASFLATLPQTVNILHISTITGIIPSRGTFCSLSVESVAQARSLGLPPPCEQVCPCGSPLSPVAGNNVPATPPAAIINSAGLSADFVTTPQDNTDPQQQQQEAPPSTIPEQQQQPGVGDVGLSGFNQQVDILTLQ